MRILCILTLLLLGCGAKHNRASEQSTSQLEVVTFGRHEIKAYWLPQEAASCPTVYSSANAFRTVRIHSSSLEPLLAPYGLNSKAGHDLCMTSAKVRALAWSVLPAVPEDSVLLLQKPDLKRMGLRNSQTINPSDPVLSAAGWSEVPISVLADNNMAY